MNQCPITLPDIQNQVDKRGISIDRVGITNVLFPIKVKKKNSKETSDYVSVSAKTKLFVGLPKSFKGINMSRFYQCLNEFSNHTISSSTMPKLLELLQKKLGSNDAYARFEFDFYVDRYAPVTKLKAPQAYRCAFTGIQKDDKYTFMLEVNVVASSVCPCSKEMSLLANLNGELPMKDHASLIELREINVDTFKDMSNQVGMGAHNQRSNIRVRVVPKDNKVLWIEDIVDLIEAQASSPVFPILKRLDEKYVTELGYKNAKFSEDITRDVQIVLMEHVDIEAWALRVYNEESIHSYDVSCYQESDNWGNHI